MIRHLLKLVWQRKRANALVLTEIFLSFLIVFAVVTMAISAAVRWKSPIGFSWQNLWVIDAQVNLLSGDHSASHTSRSEVPKISADSLAAATAVDHVLRELRMMPGVVSAAADATAPYSGNQWQTGLRGQQHQDVLLTADQATDDFARTVGLAILHGRWFQPEDEAANYLPVVLDRNGAIALFGKENPVGEKLPAEGFRADEASPKELRVVGVIASYRPSGELTSLDDRMIFFRASLLKPQPPNAKTIVIAVRNDIPADFEAQLSRRLHATSPDTTFRIHRMSQMRSILLRMALAPLAILSTIALFLISMVALGLTGVLWQTVTRRIREIGLRRALGASAHSVRTQVLVEVALLATLAVVAGIVIVAQLPLLGVFHLVRPSEFLTGGASAMAVIYAITLACGAYPSWLASRIEPADALRYE